MKRLLYLSTSQQEASISDLLEQNQIPYKKTEAGFWDRASIWVMDVDFPKAKELMEKQILVDQAIAQNQFSNEWQSKWKGSYLLWFFGNIFENPARIFSLIALVGLLSIFLWYPIYLIFQ